MKLYRTLLVFAFFSVSYAYCQEGSLSGTLKDQKEESLPFATVAVLKLPDSTVVTGTTTEMDGTFEMQPPQKGNYLLRFSAIGFRSRFTEPFKVVSPEFEKNFGAITMEEETMMLNEVMIQTWRPRIKVESGKMVMQVEGTAIAAGSTAYEMLSRAPGVSVGQSGEFSINGQSGVSVMIDGKMSYLSPAELQTLLESMPAENIEEIEVIHNPSAKYDAEGTAGILNIKLKENNMSGLNASIYGGVQFIRQTLYSGGANLSYKGGRWNSFLNLDISERGLVRDQQTLRTFPGTAEFSQYAQEGLQIREDLVPSVQAGTEYEFNEDHSISAMANVIYRDREMYWNTLSVLGNPSEDFLQIRADNRVEDIYRNAQFNLHYEGELDTLGTLISADLNFARLNSEDYSYFENEYFFFENDEKDLELLENRSFSDFDIYAAQVDLIKPFSESFKIESGVKASKVVSRSVLDFYEVQGEERIFDPEKSDNFKYEEEIYAAYLIASNRFNETWSLQAGLRAEKTVGEGYSVNLDERSNREYLEFFPNITLEQRVRDNYRLSYSYSKRIDRPDYSYFNPVIFYLDPYSYVVGNPDLRSQIATNYKVSQTFFDRYNLLLSYEYVKDFRAELPTVDPVSGETIFTTRNFDYSRSFGATIIAPFELASFWNVNNTLVLNQEKYEVGLDGEQFTNDNFFYLFQTNHQVNLPWDLKLEMNATLRGPVAYGVYNIGTQYWVDAGLKKSFFDDRLDLTISATDIFEGQKMDIDAAFLGNTIQINQYFNQRSVSINLRYNLSSAKVKSAARSTDLEELERAGG